MSMQEQHMLYYPGEAERCDSLKFKFQALYKLKKLTRNPMCPAFVHCAKRAWDHIKEKMDFSDGEVVLNDTLGAEMGNGDDDVDEDQDGAEGATNNIEELNTEVAIGEGTVLHATSSRSAPTGGGNSVTSVGGTVVELLQFPLFLPCRLNSFKLQGSGAPPIHR